MAAARPAHRLYPIDANGIELVLGGVASYLALVAPRRSLDLYASPAKYLCVSASVLFAYYAILAFGDIYCFKAPDHTKARRARLGVAARAKKVLSMGLATALAAVVLAVMFVLFGAPIASQHAETLVAGVNAALLGVTPAILTLDASVSSWRRALLSSEPKTLPEQWAAGFFWCTMTTMWAGAYFIPMDWDRPWQRWPIPIVTGAFLGNLVSLLYVLVRCFVLPIARADFHDSEAAKRQLARDMQTDPVTRPMAREDR
ncbi:Glycosylphosphatidylinositol (GPI) anchor assembly protein [Coemansia sp. RSA 552]|nr:Glycosylphosphatidylinositol (GPI) anchor assembly protein [Coemansia sp. RSA 552]